MSNRRPSVVLAMAPGNVERLFDDHLRRRLTELCDLDLGLVLHDFHTPEAATALASAEMLLTCWGCPPLTEDVLRTAPELRAVIHAAGSVKGFVTDACWRRGLRVSSAAAANAVPVAEYTVAMIVLAGKRAFPIQSAYRADPTSRAWAATYPDLGNYGITVGVVGASHVGRRVISLLRSYDVTILLADPTIDEAHAQGLGATLVDLDELVRRSDVVSIHAPNIPKTHRMFDSRRLGLMRDGATLINTARGQLVDTEALVAELSTGRIFAILDVTDPEPLPAGHPLLALPNVVLTPHIAGSLGNEIRRMGALAVDELERYVRGEPFAYAVTENRLPLLA